MNIEQYKELLLKKSLSKKQQQAVTNNKFPCYLKTSAGTGKTEVIINKVVNLINEGVGLEKIIIISFTNKVANEMSKKLRDRLYFEWANSSIENKKNWDNAKLLLDSLILKNVTTIHKFCERLIKKYGANIGIPKFSLVNDLKGFTIKIIKEKLNQYKDHYILNNIKEYIIVDIIYDILLYHYRNCMDINGNIINAFTNDTPNNNDWNVLKDIILDICYSTYHEVNLYKIKNCILTIDDLIIYSQKLFCDKDSCKQIIKEINYIFVDEFQDSDLNQTNLIKLAILNKINIFLIGDERQSIYRFRGSNLTLSNDISKLIDYKNNDNKIYLNENFRIDNNLLIKINKIFSSDFMYKKQRLEFKCVLDKGMKKGKNFKQPLRFIDHESIDHIIINLVNSYPDINFKDINVLCRSNREVQLISSILKSKNIPVIALGGGAFYNTREILDIYKLFNAAINCDTIYYNELIYTNFYLAFNTFINGTTFIEFFNELKIVINNCSIYESLDYIYKNTKIMEYYELINNRQAIYNLKKLVDITTLEFKKRNFIHPIDFIEYLDNMINSNYKEIEPDFLIDVDNAVKVSTIHKAKGLSLPIVIIPNIDKNLLNRVNDPIVLLDKSKSKFAILNIFNMKGKDLDYLYLYNDYIINYLEEELRILYVACSRAESMLILLSNTPMQELLRNKNILSWAKWIADTGIIKPKKYDY